VRTLTPRHRQFVAHYLGVSAGNATDAARRAGYPYPNKAAPRLMVIDGIRAAINAKLDETALTSDETLARISGMATGDMGDFLAIEGTAVRLDLAKAKKLGLTYLIKEFKHTRYGISIKLHDSLAALTTLARFRGLLKDRDADDEGDNEDRLAPTQAAAILKALREHDGKPGQASEGDAAGDP
jgi:hypothetical protein